MRLGVVGGGRGRKDGKNLKATPDSLDATGTLEQPCKMTNKVRGKIIFYQPSCRTRQGKRVVLRFHDVSKVESKTV